MPTFTFTIIDSKEVAERPVAIDLRSASSARKEAIILLSDMAHEVLPDGNTHDFETVVTDPKGRPIFEAILSLRARWLTSKGTSGRRERAEGNAGNRVSGKIERRKPMRTRDRKLVAKTQQYEVTYFARKHRLTSADARDILQRAGRSREKANELAEAAKR